MSPARGASWLVAFAAAMLALTGHAPAQRRPRLSPEALGIVVPPENDARLTQPPARPPIGDLVDRAARLFEAIVHDAPERAMDTFFPRGPFLVLKGIDDPARYHGVLVRHFVRDIRALHAELPDLARARFTGLTMSRRAAWQAIRSEANTLPYWAVRHSTLDYSVDGAARTLEVKVLIHWGQRWYITHLR